MQSLEYYFWDTIKDNRIDKTGIKELQTQSTNPCGEIPLSPYDSCRLLHINLYRLIKNKFTQQSDINWQKLRKISRMSVDLGNSMILSEKTKIKNILHKLEKEELSDSIEYRLWVKVLNNLKYKRLGIGKTAHGDMMAALLLNYSDLTSNTMIERALKEIDVIIEGRSKELRKVFPDCPVYDTDRINVGLHTIAPVDSGSIIADTTSGIEPLFGHVIKRRRRATEQDHVNDIETDKNGDKWIAYYHVHQPLLEWAKINNVYININSLDSINKAFELSPYYNNLAKDIIPENKLLLQQIYQSYTDHSISITHNYPKGAEHKTIYDALLLANNLKLKGFTAYVDGSRTNVLEIASTLQKESKRPNEVKAEIHKLKVKDEKFYGIVGVKENIPIELFIFKDNTIEIKNLTNAKIIKRKEEEINKYDLVSDSITIKDLASRYKSGNNIILTKLLSRLLRRGESLDKIIIDFKTSHRNIGSFQNTITSLLEYYTSNKCPNCGEAKLTFQEGCLTCQACGYSKCG